MITQFETLLQELGKELQLELHIDRKNACSLQIHPHFVIQLQLDASQEHLYIFSKLIDTPPGKYRENILKEALKANGLPDPRIGVLSYISSTNQLALFQKYPLSVLNGERLSGFLGAFMEMADSWRNAISHGQSAPLDPKNIANNPFGMK